MSTRLGKVRVNPLQISAFALTGFLLTIPHESHAQISELVNQVNVAEQGASQIGNSIFRIIKIAAGVLLAIAAITFIIVREQNSELTRKVGNTLIGLAIFYGLLEIGENLAR